MFNDVHWQLQHWRMTLPFFSVAPSLSSSAPPANLPPDQHTHTGSLQEGAANTEMQPVQQAPTLLAKFTQPPAAAKPYVFLTTKPASSVTPPKASSAYPEKDLSSVLKNMYCHTCPPSLQNKQHSALPNAQAPSWCQHRTCEDGHASEREVRLS